MKTSFDGTQDVLSRQLSGLEPPVLIVSTIVGKGIYSIGEAVQERFGAGKTVYHMPIEELLPPGAVREDLTRYDFISNKLTFLLYIIYTVPIFYLRKYLREKYFRPSNLDKLEHTISSLKIKTVICASHRPAFWLSALKSRKNMDFKLWGLLSEYGRSLGWKYIFWNAMDGYLSPVDKEAFDFDFPEGCRFFKIDLPCKNEFLDISQQAGDRNKTILVMGQWGQIAEKKAVVLINSILQALPDIRLSVVCGMNSRLHEKLSSCFNGTGRVALYGKLDSLAGLMKECGSIITKPGISTIVEAHASQRKIFLLKGMPVAEDNNARYAIRHFNAEWFSLAAYQKWHEKPGNLEK